MDTIVPPLSGISRLLEQQRQIHNAFEPFALRLEAMRLPALEFQKQMQEAMRPIAMFQTNMLASMRPLLDQHAQMQKSFEPLGLKLEAMRLPALELQKQIQEAMRPIAMFQKNMLASMSPLLDQHAQMQKSFEPLALKLVKLPIGEIESSIRTFAELSNDEVDIEYVDSEESGYSVDGEFVSIEDVKSDLTKILKKQTTADAKLGEVIKEIQKLKGKTKDIILALVVGFLFFLLSTYNPLPSKANLHDVKSSANQIELTIEQKQYLRYVYVKTVLHVREDAYIHSEVVDFLHPGTVIVLVQKDKNWSYVTYQNPITGENESGWVFSRYVKKFN